MTKHLMTGPAGNSEFYFPSTSMFPSASPQETLRVSGRQNSLFPLGSVIKCLLSDLQDHNFVLQAKNLNSLFPASSLTKPPSKQTSYPKSPHTSFIVRRLGVVAEHISLPSGVGKRERGGY